MALDPKLLLDAANAGLALYQAAGGRVDAADAAKAAAGASIIATAINLFGAVKGELSATDLPSAEAALGLIRDQANADVDRVLAEMSGDLGI